MIRAARPSPFLTQWDAAYTVTLSLQGLSHGRRKGGHLQRSARVVHCVMHPEELMDVEVEGRREAGCA
jgi:hypothetical protein